jgi:hypothetical protein
MKLESEAELMANQTCSDKIKLNPGATASIHEDGLIILQIPSGRIFTSNRTGARIWHCLEQQVPLELIAAEIARDYRIDRATAREDVASFLAELERNGLTERGAE